MTTIIIICFLSYLFYKIGGGRWMLEKATIFSDAEPINIKIRKREKPIEPAPQVSKYEQTKRTRQQLEADTSYILAKMGLNPETSKYMGDEMLKAITREYLDNI